MLAYLGVLLVLCGLANSVCYYPNGDTTPGDMPCDDSKPQSACCGIGYVCLSNNLCMKSRPSNEERQNDDYSRGSCTDKTWRSSSCPNFCAREEAPYNDTVSDGIGMAKCPDTDLDMYFCIDADVANVDCVNQVNVLVFPGTPSILTTIGVAGTESSTSSSSISIQSSTQTSSLSQESRVTPLASPSSSSSLSIPFSTSSTSSTSSSTTTVSSSASPADVVSSLPPANPKPNNNAIPIGIGVGVGAAVVILGLLGAFLFRRYRRRVKRVEDIDGTEEPYQDMMVHHGHLSIAKSELPAYEPNHTRNTYELQGNS